MALDTGDIPRAVRVIRRMKGGSGAHLVSATDGKYYVVKYQQNPQGIRSLINDFFGARVFCALGISTAAATTIIITKDFLTDNRAVFQQLDKSLSNVQPGLHFGSLYPGDPSSVVVHDLLPTPFVRKLVNQDDFIGALIADKWLGNCDWRQAIYYRVSCRWMCQMIDFGAIFGGPDWRFRDAPGLGLAPDLSVYCVAGLLTHLEKWLSRVTCFPEKILLQIAAAIPDEWLQGERAEFEKLLEKLARRRGRIRDLLEDAFRNTAEPFRSWWRYNSSNMHRGGRLRAAEKGKRIWGAGNIG